MITNQLLITNRLAELSIESHGEGLEPQSLHSLRSFRSLIQLPSGFHCSHSFAAESQGGDLNPRTPDYKSGA